MDPTQFFKCLADDTRLKSLMLIRLEKELCVCELMLALEDSQPKISRHLAQLKKHGILLDRKQSQWVYYRINPELPAWAQDVITLSTSKNMDFLRSNLEILQATPDRPERIKECCA